MVFLVDFSVLSCFLGVFPALAKSFRETDLRTMSNIALNGYLNIIHII